MASANHYLTRNVFVAGRTPDVTYNPRDERHLETEVRGYLNQPGKALSVSGPTKSGKTVLIARLLPSDESIWLQGSDLTSVEVLWRRVVDWFGLYDVLGISEGNAGSGQAQASAQIGVPGLASFSGSISNASEASTSRSWTRTRSYSDVAREALEAVTVPIVIDDFHYVPNAVKRDVARALKSIIPFAHVIMIAVPHEAFEVVREEPEMGGRVWQLEVAHWTVEELLHISRTGFEALNVVDRADEIGTKLAQASHGAPFLMQQLCYDVMVAQAVHETQSIKKRVIAPDSWADFFHRIAIRSAPAVFDKLLKGPNPRGQERTKRVFNDGRVTDIYGAVMHAIAKSGPQPRIRYQELSRILERDLVDAPRSQNVTSSLSHMANIAREARGSGDPALDYKEDELHILDPFLLFFLEHGSWDVERHALT